MSENWDKLTDDELGAELRRREVDYRNFVDAQQFAVNAKARYISAMKSELFRRKVAAQSPEPTPADADARR